MTNKYPLFSNLPEAGALVAPSIESIVHQLRSHHQGLAAEAAGLLLGTPATEAEQRVGQAALSTRIMAVMARRLDPDASDRLHAAADEMEVLRQMLWADDLRERMDEPSAAQLHVELSRSKITMTMALSEGLMVTTMIDGPARGSATVNVVAAANANAEATAHALATVTIDQLAAEVRGDQELPDEIAVDLDDLKQAVESGEDATSLLARLGRIAEKAKPFAGLASSLAALARTLLG